VNLGIFAHVDAGKTSLTERLLFEAGVIDEIGSVDDGTTQTDTLALERQRGITIKSAVASFEIHGTAVNLIDTPGHPDFIAEVERVLGVLDGAVLVVSAVEGVQAQTRVLMRALQRLRIPTLIFVNKIDRRGADIGRVQREIAAKLTPAVVPMGSARGLGTRGAAFVPYGPGDSAFRGRLLEVLAEHDDELLAAYVRDTPVPYSELARKLAGQVRRALVHAVYFGSATTGAGASELAAGLVRLLPAVRGDPAEPASGLVFKVERGPAGEKIAYARMFAGTVRIRDSLRFGAGGSAKVTAIRVLSPGGAAASPAVVAGQIAMLWGLAGIRVGDPIGEPQAGPGSGRQFAPPTLEAVVRPDHGDQSGALHLALTQLTEQDPLIRLRQDEGRGELLVSLYGEVHKEVIAATLASDFGIDVGFSETITLHIERPVGAGAAAEFLGAADNPFNATVGLRVEPAAHGSGTAFRLEIEPGALPLAFQRAVEESARQTLTQGLHGWLVTDCAVILTHSGYVPPSSSASDFRNLTPLVLMSALQRAGTAVFEPMHRFSAEIPADLVGLVVPALARLGAVPGVQQIRGSTGIVAGHIAAARARKLAEQVAGLTRGEGVLECVFDHYRQVSGPIPARPRSDHNPLNRKEYLLHVLRVAVTGR
jgi:ribosomal protection tetracycline resistance protein